MSAGIPRQLRFSNRESLASALADEIAADLARGIAERGRSSLVVSGGSTPLPLFRQLRQRTVDWSAVEITLADERWVAADHPDSNEGLVRAELLQGAASVATFVPLKNSAATPREGQVACRAALAEIVSPFDVVILGMGSDGHTASLFPAADELDEGLDRSRTEACLAVRPPNAPHLRMSLTLHSLLNSRRQILHITGGDKLRVYQRALGEGPTRELPIRGLLRHAANLDVFWAP